MVVNNLNIFGIASFPPKYDAPLIVDPDRIKSCELPFKRFKSISRRHSQVHEFGGVMYIEQLASGSAPQSRRKLTCLFGGSVIKQILRKLIAKALNHCCDVIG